MSSDFSQNVLANFSITQWTRRIMQTVMGTPESTVQPAASGTAGSFDAAIAAAALRHNLPEELIRAVIKVESNFNPRAVSAAGAKGLMQLMDGTARGLGVLDSFDPVQNIEGGATYLRNMLDRFGSLPLALAAYNAGPGAVQQYGGIPAFEETQRYVQQVLALSNRDWEA